MLSLDKKQMKWKIDRNKPMGEQFAQINVHTSG